MSPETTGDPVRRGNNLSNGSGREHNLGDQETRDGVTSGIGSVTSKVGSDSSQNSPSTHSRVGSATSGGSRMISVKVHMLDDSITLFQVQAKAPGRILFDQVCKQLNLLEVDYFGLEYQDAYRVTVSFMKFEVAQRFIKFAFSIGLIWISRSAIKSDFFQPLFARSLTRQLWSLCSDSASNFTLQTLLKSRRNIQGS